MFWGQFSQKLVDTLAQALYIEEVIRPTAVSYIPRNSEYSRSLGLFYGGLYEQGGYSY